MLSVESMQSGPHAPRAGSPTRRNAARKPRYRTSVDTVTVCFVASTPSPGLKLQQGSEQYSDSGSSLRARGSYTTRGSDLVH